MQVALVALVALSPYFIPARWLLVASNATFPSVEHMSRIEECEREDGGGNKGRNGSHQCHLSHLCPLFYPIFIVVAAAKPLLIKGAPSRFPSISPKFHAQNLVLRTLPSMTSSSFDTLIPLLCCALAANRSTLAAQSRRQRHLSACVLLLRADHARPQDGSAIRS